IIKAARQYEVIGGVMGNDIPSQDAAVHPRFCEELRIKIGEIVKDNCAFRWNASLGGPTVEGHYSRLAPTMQFQCRVGLLYSTGNQNPRAQQNDRDGSNPFGDEG